MVVASFKHFFHARPFITAAVAIWICVTIYLCFKFFNLRSNNEQDLTYQSLLEVITGLEKQVDAQYKTGNTIVVRGIRGMSSEILRRRALQYVREVKYSLVQLDNVNEKMNDIKNCSSLKPLEEIKLSVEQLKRHLHEMSTHLQVNIDGIGRVDGMLESRIKYLDILSNELQNELFKLQNPPDCKKAKFIVAWFTLPCGFGCNAHYLMRCFHMAYATGRTLILNSAVSEPYTQWWMKNFLPLSQKCNITDIQSNNHSDSFDKKSLDTYQSVGCPNFDSSNPPFDWMPPAVPSHLSKVLSHLHGAPFIWFIGQLAKFLMRPAFDLSEASKILTDQTENPIVGVHIRRTDKLIWEARFHSLEEYITEVENYFQFIDAERQMMSRTEEWKSDIKSPIHHNVQHQLKPVKRRVYLATDEPSLFDEARLKYPNYTFYGDRRRADSAAISNRLNNDSIIGIVTDILLLSKTNFLVCTFTSNVCRLAYELMQSNHLEFGDASQQFRSLDDVYHFVGQQLAPYEVVISNIETDLSRGDLVQFLGNHWNGYADVEKLNTGRKVMAPAFKFTSRLMSAPMIGAHTNRSEFVLDNNK